MTHPDKERKLGDFPERESPPKRGAAQEAFEKWMDSQLEKLEQRFAEYMTVNSARHHYGR